MSKYLIAFLFTLCYYTNLFPQTTISGKLVDNQHKPIPNVTVLKYRSETVFSFRRLSWPEMNMIPLLS